MSENIPQYKNGKVDLDKLVYSADKSYRISVPKYEGSYRVGTEGHYFQICILKKPNWLHRKMMKLCLGWEWIDNE